MSTCPPSGRALRADGATRRSRLAVRRATQQVLATGLGLLGVEAPDRM